MHDVAGEITQRALEARTPLRIRGGLAGRHEIEFGALPELLDADDPAIDAGISGEIDGEDRRLPAELAQVRGDVTRPERTGLRLRGEIVRDEQHTPHRRHLCNICAHDLLAERAFSDSPRARASYTLASRRGYLKATTPVSGPTDPGAVPFVDIVPPSRIPAPCSTIVRL